MSKWKRILKKVAGIVPVSALMLATTTMECTCVWWFHQPKVPEGLKKDEK